MYEKEIEFLKKTVKEAYESTKNESVFVDEKGVCDVVTNVDRAIEKKITNAIKETFPDYSIHAEEFNPESELKDKTFIIDPIDGTYNFSVGSRDFGVQTAFFDKGEVVVSVIYMPNFSELYWASKGKGAYCNGKKLKASSRPVDKAIVSVGDFPHSRPDDSFDQMQDVKRCYSRVARLRMFGGACIDYTLFASGKTDGLFLYTKNKWDLAPGICLCREAGGIVLGLDGEEYDFSKRGMCIVNSLDLYRAIFVD